MVGRDRCMINYCITADPGSELQKYLLRRIQLCVQLAEILWEKSSLSVRVFSYPHTLSNSSVLRSEGAYCTCLVSSSSPNNVHQAQQHCILFHQKYLILFNLRILGGHASRRILLGGCGESSGIIPSDSQRHDQGR